MLIQASFYAPDGVRLEIDLVFIRERIASDVGTFPMALSPTGKSEMRYKLLCKRPTRISEMRYKLLCKRYQFFTGQESLCEFGNSIMTLLRT